MDYVPINGLLVGVVAKAASQSLRECSDGFDVRAEDALIYPRRIFFIRHPVRRLESAFSFFKTLALNGTIYSKFDVRTKPTWKLFVDHVLSGAKDEHWNLQVEGAFHKGEYTPTETYRFEDLGKWFHVHVPRELRHLNTSIKHDTPDYRLSALRRFYKRDMDVWLAAKQFDGAEGEQKWL